MKNKIILLILGILLLSGCKKDETIETLSCTFESTDSGYTSVITAEVNKDKLIKNAIVKMTYDDSEEAKRMCNLLKSTGDKNGNLKCNDKEITVKNFHKSMNGKEKLTKEEFTKYMEDSKYTCK